MSVSKSHYTTAGRLAVEIHADRAGLGLAAARAAAAYIRGADRRTGRSPRDLRLRALTG